MNKKELRQCKTIDMRYFLETYYNITNQALISKIIRLSHRDIKQILELYGIKARNAGFQDLTRENIASGEILLVLDGHHNVAPYLNPLFMFEEDYEKMSKKVIVRK